MKSLEAFYQSDLLPDLEKLESERLSVKKKFMQAVLVAVGLNLVFLFIAGKFGLNLIFLLIFLALTLIFTFFPWHIRYYKPYNQGFKDAIIPKIVAFIDQRLRYDKDGMVSREEFVDSHLFNDRPDEYQGDDLVSGTLGDTAIRFSEIHAKRVDIVRQGSSSSSTDRETRKKYTPIFNGLFFVADFNKSFKGRTIVLPDSAQKLFGDLGQALQALNVGNGQLIKMEDPEFEELFVVYGEDQVEARYILSTSLMRRIVDFQTRVQNKIRISFSASKLHVAIPFERELFEPKIMESLLNISHVQEYYDDLKLVIDIVEDLNLNTRIWTPKGQVAPSGVAAANAASAIDLPITKATPPPPPGNGSRTRLSDEETRAAFEDFVNKADSSMAPKIKTAKRWLKRIAAVFLLLLCLPFLFSGAYMAGLIILGFGLFFLVGGFFNPSMEMLTAAIVFTGIGIVIALFSYKAYQVSLESKDWPNVQGVITRSEVEQQTSTTGEGANKKTTVNAYPKITYQYQIGGQIHESTRISFSSTSGNANQMVSRYPKGKTVPVYYNPTKPKQAVLVPGNSGLNIVPYIFSAVSILLGVGCAKRLRKQTVALGNKG